MKTLLILSTCIFLTSGILFGQGNEACMQYIRVCVNKIQENRDSFQTRIIEIHNESTEGGKATAYYKESDLKMLEIAWFGETGKRVLEYYFEQGKLVFANDRDFDYNRPIYWDKKRAEENGDDEVFDPDKTTVKADSYFFQNEELFLWLDNDNKEIDLNLGTNSIVGQGLIADCHKMVDEFKKE